MEVRHQSVPGHMETKLHHSPASPDLLRDPGLPPFPQGGPAIQSPQVGRRTRLLQSIVLSALFLVFLYLFWLFPITGDDWFREELGRNLRGLSDLAETVISGWRTYNARLLGNILAYSAGGRKILRELMRSSITLGLVYTAARLSGFRSPWGTLLAAAAILALPREMFAQIYPWAAGFFNYVPPVLMLLTAFWLLRAVFAETPVADSVPRAAAVFLLGFGGQLFIENYTVYAVWAGAVLVIWSRWQQKKWSVAVLAFFAGTVLGAALLFASPSYGLIFQSGGGYETGLSQGLSGLLETAQGNLEEVLRFLISGCPVLFVSLTALGLVWFARSGKKSCDWLAASVLLLGCLYFAINCAAKWQPQANLAVVLLWGLALGLGCWRWLPGARPEIARCSSGPVRWWPRSPCCSCFPLAPGACICPMYSCC